jgi:hypothetical protein
MDDDDEVENEGKSGKKNIIILKEKTQKRVRALLCPSSRMIKRTMNVL